MTLDFEYTEDNFKVLILQNIIIHDWRKPSSDCCLQTNLDADFWIYGMYMYSAFLFLEKFENLLQFVGGKD